MTTSLQITSLHLRVPDLARSVDFYARQLGFAVISHNTSRAELGAAPSAPALLVLSEDRAARPASTDAAGLFHAALLLPSRAALGGWLRQAAAAGAEFDGFSDHGVSEAIYLSDPDGNGLEFYVDRPRAVWPYRNGELAMVTRPLEVDSLLADGQSVKNSAIEGGRWGHLHLRVTDLDRSEAFYTSALGLNVTQRSIPQARFLSTDGYHHHLGLNTWGHPRTAQPTGALGLVEATVTRAGFAAGSQRITDPDGIRLCVAGA
jgi:catechol 2,3-dioxygenase